MEYDKGHAVEHSISAFSGLLLATSASLSLDFSLLGALSSTMLDSSSLSRRLHLLFPLLSAESSDKPTLLQIDGDDNDTAIEKIIPSIVLWRRHVK
jgi:hypothetical protein